MYRLRLLSVESETDPKSDLPCPFTRNLERSRSVLGPVFSSGPTSYRVSGPTLYRFQEAPCERKAIWTSIWDRSQIYPVRVNGALKTGPTQNGKAKLVQGEASLFYLVLMLNASEELSLKKTMSACGARYKLVANNALSAPCIFHLNTRKT